MAALLATCCAAPALAARDLRAAGGSTGGARHLLACEPQPISFENKCRYTVYLAIYGLLGNDDGLASGFCIDGARPAGTWCTRAWFKLEPGKQARVMYSANRYLYYYAKDAPESLVWEGGDSAELLLDVPDSALSSDPCTLGSTPSCRPMIKARAAPRVR